MDELDALLDRQVRVLSVRQALRFLTRSAVRSRLRSGRWQRPHRAVLVAHNGDLTDQQRLWVASLAAGDGEPALLAGYTALRAHGMSGHEPPAICVLIRADQRHRDPPAGVRIYRTSTLSKGDVFAAGLPPRTRPARSVVDAAAWARSDREAKVIIACAFQQRLVRLEDVLDAVSRAPRARRRQLTARTARDAAAGATALGELDLLDVIRRAGLPEPRRQHRRRDANGRRRYLDFYYPEWGLHIEVDGAHHLNPLEAWDDMERQNALWTRGDRVLRFPAWMVRDRPDVVAAQIRAALRAAGWPG